MNVKPDVEVKEIKKSYYKLAQKYHPDRAGDDKTAIEKFKQVTNAYEVLSDESSRREYDRQREETLNPNASFNN